MASVAGPIASAAIGSLGSLAGGKAQADAYSHAADLQSQSAKAALAFQQQQAAQDFANNEANRHANYDQWAAREGRLSNLAQMVGSQPFQIPAYVPLKNVNALVGPAPTTGSASMQNLVDYNG